MSKKDLHEDIYSAYYIDRVLNPRLLGSRLKSKQDWKYFS